jgi:uncharacterized protein (UPF0297 family)
MKPVTLLVMPTRRIKKTTHGGRRPRAGRKPKNRHAQLSVWIKSGQRAWLKAQADARKISMSDCLEEILQQAMGIKEAIGIKDDQHAWLKAQANVRKISLDELLEEILRAEMLREQSPKKNSVVRPLRS